MRQRLLVFRSNKYIYGQIQGPDGKILVSVDQRELKAGKGTKIEKAALVGELLAKKAIAAKITQVYFDRRGYRYHGRVKALAQAARKGGLVF